MNPRQCSRGRISAKDRPVRARLRHYKAMRPSKEHRFPRRLRRCRRRGLEVLLRASKGDRNQEDRVCASHFLFDSLTGFTLFQECLKWPPRSLQKDVPLYQVRAADELFPAVLSLMTLTSCHIIVGDGLINVLVLNWRTWKHSTLNIHSCKPGNNRHYSLFQFILATQISFRN